MLFAADKPMGPLGALLDAVGDDTSVPTICTRRPIHDVMSAPLSL
jgi:hypothetical protein